ncbi:MAG: MFS transporter [Burkholderiaceae bacterium]
MSRQHIVLPAVVLTVGVLMNMLSRGLIETFAVFLLPLGEAFKADRAAITVIYSTYMLVYGLSAPLMGYLIDRIGVRVCYLLGLLLLGGGFWFAGSATELWHLYLLLGVACGAGAAALGMVPASMLASYWFDRRLPSAMSLLYASLGMGVLVFSPLSQWLIDTRGLHAAYRSLALAPLLLLPLILLLPWKTILSGESALRARRESAVRKGVKSALLRALREASFGSWPA